MPTGLSDRIQQFRERVQRRNRAKQAEERAQAREERIETREQAEQERARQQRIRENDPETLREEAAASARQIRLLSSELGIDTESARNVVDDASQILKTAREQGQGAVEQLDTDGDGDTDILQLFESETNAADSFDVEDQLLSGGGGGSGEPFDPGTATFDPGMSQQQSGGQQGGIDPTDASVEEDLLDL